MSRAPDISFDLLHKYNVQGPRYTSYPPAPSWSSDIGPQDYEKIIEESHAVSTPAPLSLYLHLPFCEKLCYFCGCTTLITGKNRSFEDPYLNALLAEIQWISQRVDKSRPVVQFHFGGGTPTFHAPDTLTKLIETVKKHFSFEDDCEMAIEVDPRVTTENHLNVLKDLGFNRLSMGVQDFSAPVQKAINRIQPYEETKTLVDQARVLGFTSLNFDLIYGLPYQTPDSFNKTIDQILSLSPDRLAVYSYAHVPWLKKHQAPLEAHLPTEKEKFDIFCLALKRFTEAGLDYIGMDHFAKPDDELSQARANRTLWRNFMGYTTKSGTDLFGLGMSAISHINHCFVQNEREIKPYQEAIQSGSAATLRGFRLSKDDKIRSRLIQNLLCHGVVMKKEMEKDFGIEFDAYFLEPLKNLKQLEKDGLVELKSDKIAPTSLGRVFLRNIAMPFDAYLPKKGEKQVFSRTV